MAEDWIDSTVPGKSLLEYGDIFEVSENLSKELKEKDGVDIVIALTHSRKKIDRLLTGVYCKYAC